MRLSPIDLARHDLGQGWRLIAPLNRRHKRALANLERAFPDKTPEERERIALAAWENLGRVMVETMNIDRILEGARTGCTSPTATGSAATRTRWGRR